MVRNHLTFDHDCVIPVPCALILGSDSDCTLRASQLRLRSILTRWARYIRRWGAETERDLNQKMRKLVQKLGEAIHASVSESEYIAGVVQDIRRQGFDVL